MVHVEGEKATEQVSSSSEPRGTGEGNLVQLPIGAKFGVDHAPTPQERENLVRFAAEAGRELHGEDPDPGDQDAGE